MKLHNPTFRCLTAVVAAFVLCGRPLAARSEDAPASTNNASSSIATNSPSTDNIQQSVFTIPSMPSEGRDPFFPNLTDVELHATPDKSGKPGESAVVPKLTLQGISGSAERRLAVIGGHSFAAGEEGDVITPGGRVRIRCLEINETSVVIEIGGQRQELRFLPLK